MAESLTKGMRVIVSGRLKSRSYETKEGEKRTVIELEVDEIGPSLPVRERQGQPDPAVAERRRPCIWQQPVAATSSGSLLERHGRPMGQRPESATPAAVGAAAPTPNHPSKPHSFPLADACLLKPVAGVRYQSN